MNLRLGLSCCWLLRVLCRLWSCRGWRASWRAWGSFSLEVVEESSLPFLHCSEQAFNTAHECLWIHSRPRAFRASGYHGPLSTRI